MADVIEALRASTQEIEGAKQRMQEISKQQEAAGTVLEEATASGTVMGPQGVTSVQADAQRRAGELEAQTRNQRLANTANYEEVSNKLMQVLSQQREKTLGKLQEIDEINSSSNPLAHIVGLVTIPFKAAQAQTAAAVGDAAHKGLIELNQAMQSSAKTSDEISTKITEASNADLTEALAKDQVAAAARAKIQALATSAHNIRNILDMSAQQVNNKVQEFNIGEAQSMRELRRAQIQQIMEQRELIGDEKQARTLAIDSINYALAKNNKSPIPADQEVSVLRALESKTPLGDMLRNLQQQGLLGRISEDKFSQGNTPAEALQARTALGYQPIDAVEQELLGVVDSLLINAPEVKAAKTAQQKIDAGNLAVQNKLLQDQEDISIEPRSLVKPMTWDTMSRHAAFKNDPVYKTVLAPQITPNIAKDHIAPNELFKRLNEAIAQKQISITDAARFQHTYANASILLTNDLALRKLTGLEQTKFTAKLELPRVRTARFGMDKDSSIFSMSIPAAALVDVTKSLLPHILDSVDHTNETQLIEAFTAVQANRLREPTK